MAGAERAYDSGYAGYQGDGSGSGGCGSYGGYGDGGRGEETKSSGRGNMLLGAAGGAVAGMAAGALLSHALSKWFHFPGYRTYDFSRFLHD